MRVPTPMSACQLKAVTGTPEKPTMQFQGKLKFLFGQKKKAPSGTVLPPRLSLFCIVAPVLLPSMAETTMKSTFLRARHRADPTAPPGTRAKATTSLCESELHGKPNYLAGKSGGGNGISVYGAQTDTGRWPRGPARAPCLCFRGGPKLVLDPEGAAGDQEEEEQERPLSCSSGVRGWRETHMYNCRFETLGPTRYLSWTAEKCCQDGSVTRKLQPSKCNLFSMCATPRGSCTPYPGVQGTFNASSITVFRNSPLSHPPGQPPSVYSSRTSRPTRDGAQGQVHPPACHFPQGSLENRLPEPGAQCFTAGVYSTEDAKLRSLQTPLGAPCNPMLPLDVPIKMENDSGSEDTADGYSSSQVWLGASDVARKHLVAFPSRMHLKTEPDSRCQLYMPQLGHSVLGAPPHGRATAGPSRELAPFYPTQCTCLECMHGLPEPEPPHHLCTQGCGEHQPSTLGCDCRAPGATPMVKQEPLDSPPWATHSQRGVPGMFRKSALGTLIPPKAPECAFLL
ncbi:PREDICTED: aryl hydrocarbon receptor repressor-like [Galeopterus variegatus]|uniref:Aryl hydrocarbon receptor repressor-like n=2 Tax=Galeopterus variegatus TaxID=482537 RepID=A0ABM0R3L2_GALVR|nr:PREDICTED: aryl hydrocarbon receptor repressor-like [Galeopterus variegatus]